MTAVALLGRLSLDGALHLLRPQAGDSRLQAVFGNRDDRVQIRDAVSRQTVSAPAYTAALADGACCHAARVEVEAHRG
jgi:hypothetical protein